MNSILIRNSTSSTNNIYTVKYCASFFSKFVGLMFRKRLDEAKGIVLVQNKDARLDSAIHMLFMNFDIAVIWVNENHTVVDKVIAHRWAWYYCPIIPAKYTIELSANAYDQFNIGDKLTFENL